MKLNFHQFGLYLNWITIGFWLNLKLIGNWLDLVRIGIGFRLSLIEVFFHSYGNWYGLYLSCISIKVFVLVLDWTSVVLYLDLIFTILYYIMIAFGFLSIWTGFGLDYHWILIEFVMNLDSILIESILNLNYIGFELDFHQFRLNLD